MMRRAFAMTFSEHPRRQSSSNKVTLDQIAIRWPKVLLVLSEWVDAVEKGLVIFGEQ
jgi:hypothetical protein